MLPAPRYQALSSTIQLCERLRVLRRGQDPAADLLTAINVQIGVLLHNLDVDALPMPDRVTVRDACNYARGNDE